MMLLDKYQLPTKHFRNNKECFLDPVRNIFVQVNPEEIVRQQMVVFLRKELGVPLEMIRLEEPMMKFKRGAKGRADIIVYQQEGDSFFPLILIECKNPTIELTDNVFEQAVRYDQILLADCIVLTNGNSMEWYIYNGDKEQYLLLSEAPTYEQLLEKKSLKYDQSKPCVWERPLFSSLTEDKTYKEFLDKGWIGEDTSFSLRTFIMNISGCLHDLREEIVPGDYQGVNIIKDGGIRYTRFGNSAGGNWLGEYRYVLIEDESGNTQIISFAVLGSLKAVNHPVFGNRKGHSSLIVAIDDFEKSHNSLQLNLDKYTFENEDNDYIIWHDGKLTNGNKGSSGKSAVIDFIKEYSPDLIDENDRVFLGRFVNDDNFRFSQDEMSFFLGRIIKYALVRDKFRKTNC
jgi:hypothetical protein